MAGTTQPEVVTIMRVFRVTALLLSLSLLALPTAVRAQARVVDVTGSDAMKFSVTTIAAKAGEQLTSA